MPQPFTCPACQGAFLVPDHAYGKKVRCPSCKAIVEVVAPTNSPPAPTQQQQQREIPISFDTPTSPPAPQEESLPWTRDARPIAKSQGRSDDDDNDDEDDEADARRKPSKGRKSNLSSLDPKWGSVAAGLGCMRYYVLLYWIGMSVLLFMFVYAAIIARPAAGNRGVIGNINGDLGPAIMIAVGALFLIGFVLQFIGRLLCGSAPKGVIGRNFPKGAALMSVLAFVGGVVGVLMSSEVKNARFVTPSDFVWLQYGYTLISLAGMIGELWFVLFLFQIPSGVQDPTLARPVVRFFMLFGWTMLAGVTLGFAIASAIVSSNDVETRVNLLYAGLALVWLLSTMIAVAYLSVLNTLSKAIRQRIGGRRTRSEGIDD